MLRGLLLDFYGTVVEDDDDIMAAIAGRVAASAAGPVTGAEVGAAWGREYEAVASGPWFRTLRECASQSLATVMGEVGCPGDAAALCVPQFTHWRSPPLRPGTREFLSRLDVPVCVVSDVDRADLEAATALHGLTFTAVVTSEDVGAYKPDRAMFTRALDALGLGPDEVMHVGDSFGADVRGAHAAGIRAAWVNRRGRVAPDGTPVAYEVTDLAGLAALLRPR
ncbi:2-haloacid dehalogenase/putative hydrolase of the HAD superfamily [Micromonospora pisi]|uniref:2-haloacid dehalogenase/putative hydrolase of the HAD superfamily n=1 Tax=Micromonospora pisi TaxID=589240 RepID=A0A495JT65_9ACTN|nr:HAD family hydrolase [Micromonospora pisi]RKR92163.1 2-haloacid dehalogenase/putative hydrolase of the HAD superfamily [Micromonospora pisi]